MDKYQKYYLKNVDKMKEKNRRYRHGNPDTIYNNHLKHRYGITLEQFNKMLLDQDNKCGICNKKETRLGKGGQVRKLSVDHCHKTGKIRMLLCDDCNKAIGLVKENIDIVRKIEYYLVKFLESK